MKRYLIPCLLAILAGTTLSADVGSSRGGSNYNWYNLDGCSRESFGIIKNYHRSGVRDRVKSQLDAMYRNGQRKLRIGIYHSTSYSTGTVMQHSGNNLTTQERTNLTNFLQDIKARGFNFLLVGFFPQGDNNPKQWNGTWKEAEYQINWNLIVNLRSIILNNGPTNTWLDLLNEGIPPPQNTTLKDYTKRLWSDYTAQFGKANTVGFSLIGNPTDNRVPQMPEVYGKNYPSRFDVHFYDDEKNKFVGIHNQMSNIGLGNVTWMIGESFYNDATAYSRFNQARTQTGRNVQFQLQWPITRQRNCSDVDVAWPEDYDNYF